MRVLITTPHPSMPGGVANYFDVLRPYLDPIAEYHVVGSRPMESSRLRIALRLMADYLLFFRRLACGTYDLVHLNPSFAFKSLPRDAILLLLAKAFGHPVLVFVRGWDQATEHRLALRWGSLFRLVYGRADTFVVLATEFSRKLRELGYRGAIEEETTVASNAGQTAALRIPRPRPFRILFLSRVEKAKGIYELVEAYRRLRNRFDLVELVIAGDGSERDPIQQHVQRLGLSGVRFAGHVTGTDKATLYEEASVFVLASYSEGMPNAILEGMAQGLPVVTHAVGGIRDFFENGVMGFSTESLDPAVYAELIERIMCDAEMAARMGAYNRRYAAHKFAAPRVASRLLCIYERVIARKANSETQAYRTTPDFPKTSGREG